MKRSIFFSVILIAAVGLSGCMKRDGGWGPGMDGGCDGGRDGGRDGNHNPGQTHVAPVMFQYEYYNYAWGFRHSGFLIGTDGKVRGFKQPEKWIAQDSTGLLSKSDLEYNLAQCDTVSGKVNMDDLSLYYSRIKDIRTGEIVDNGMIMADAGTGVFSAWYWNEKVQKYENVFIVSNGDRSKINTHPEAAELIAWLRWIGTKTNRFWWYGK